MPWACWVYREFAVCGASAVDGIIIFKTDNETGFTAQSPTLEGKAEAGSQPKGWPGTWGRSGPLAALARRWVCLWVLCGGLAGVRGELVSICHPPGCGRSSLLP